MRSLEARAKLPALVTLLDVPPANALPSMEAIEPMRDAGGGAKEVGDPDCARSPAAVPPA